MTTAVELANQIYDDAASSGAEPDCAIYALERLADYAQSVNDIAAFEVFNNTCNKLLEETEKVEDAENDKE